MSDSMHQPRDANGRFATPLTKDVFEEYRRATDQRFKASEEAVDAARATLDELTKTHATAHAQQHADNKEALSIAKGEMDLRVKKLESVLEGRLRKVEDAVLISATVDDVKGLDKKVEATATGMKSGINKTGAAAVIAGLLAAINFVINLTQGVATPVPLP
jgi:hypothetical protein